MRDGTVEDVGGGEDLDSYGDENYTLALRWEKCVEKFVISPKI